MKKCTLLASILLAIPVVGWPQSRIQCVQGPDGRLQAAQIWQNTLGVARANDICNTQVRTVEKAPGAPAEVQVGRFDDATYANASRKSGSEGAGTTEQPPASTVGQEGGVPGGADIPVGFERIW